ncbi:hypothetical protein CA54_00520 [Symmachiella macrocystis]|uniref:Uncharacterized protein n=1 Tax=Symmachiella macrocystis TaxID=2527985 RepID=A0A5C6BGT6_9PLAN|nr:hypothetical protein [Symmachiella macrocystis]TWU11248.1 hypothetical protein CA54_00520 [Symmachiella macrocystis]
MKLFGMIAAIMAVTGISVGAINTSSVNDPAVGSSIAPVSEVDFEDDYEHSEEKLTGGCGESAHRFND